jgi:hypothetical protein
MRREALRAGARREPERLQLTAEGHFGLPAAALDYWKASRAQRPWQEPSPD